MSDEKVERWFLDSWDRIEIFYADLLSHVGWECVHPITGLIRDLRARGYDKKLRAGQSMWFFILSRSKLHGLEPHQHCVTIRPQVGGGMLIEYHSPEGVETMKSDQMNWCPELETVLARLMEQEIN